MSPSGTQRRPRRNLVSPRRGSGEQQVGNVCASDQQHDADRTEEHPQRRAHVPNDVLLQGDQVETLTVVQNGISLFQAAREYQALGQGKVGESISATAAFVDGRIYLRSEGRLYCIGAQGTEG